MNKEIEIEIRDYVLSEILEVNSPISNEKLHIIDLEEALDLLFAIFTAEIDYADLRRLEEKFEKNIIPIIKGELSALPHAIESLASNYEAYLKKIAYLKYSGTIYWEGGSSSKGLKNTMLFDLCNGKIDGRPKTDIPEPLVNYSGAKSEILDFVRKNLRNAVHNAPTYRKTDLFNYANLVISTYLFTALDNKMFLKNNLFPEYKYLKSIVENRDLSGMNKVYVELLGQYLNKNSNTLDIQLHNAFELLSMIENYEQEEGDFSSEGEEVVIDRISNIIMGNNNLLLVGTPGSGKSTVLKHILYSSACMILNEGEDIKIPFFIEANEFRHRSKSIKDILFGKIDKDTLIKILAKGKARILIDGINEVLSEDKQKVIREIKDLISVYPSSSFVMTDRKHEFSRDFGGAVFELRNLDEIQIRDFIKHNTIYLEDDLWDTISQSEELSKMASNPLMLKMYISVLRHGEAPMNRGQLYNLFLDTVLLREERKKIQVDRDEKKVILSVVAYLMRKGGVVSADKDHFSRMVGDSIVHRNLNVNETFFIRELQDNNIIKQNVNGEISFSHETYQEYFCALYLKRWFIRNGELPIDLSESDWVEPLLLCNDIITNQADQIDFFNYLVIGQKTKNKPKRIIDFNSEDFNVHIHLACKVARRHRDTNEAVFNQALLTVRNYMAVYKMYINKHNQAPLRIGILIDAISSLSDRDLLSKFFLDIFWIEQWIYCDEDEENWYLSEERNLKYEEDFKEIVDRVIDNTSDFTILLSIISKSLKTNVWFKSVTRYLKIFRDSILQSISSKKLIEYLLESDFDTDFFLSALRYDISLMDLYDFENQDANSNLRVMQTLVAYHNSKHEALTIVINELTSKDYPEFVYKRFSQIFYDYKHIPFLMSLCEHIYKTKPDIYNEISSVLQKIPFKSLTDILKTAFTKNFVSKVEIEYDGVLSLGVECAFILKESSYTHFAQIKDSNKLITINDFFVTPVLDFDYCNYTNESEFTIGLTDMGDTASKHTLSYEGNILLKKNGRDVVIPYARYKISRKSKNFIFRIDMNAATLLPRNNEVVCVNNEFFMRVKNINARQCKKVIIFAYNKDRHTFPRSGKISFEQATIDIKHPEQYHPDLLSTESITLEISNELKQNNVLATFFVKQLGLTHLFYSELDSIDFGVVCDSYMNSIVVFHIKQEKYNKYYYSAYDDSAYKRGDVLIVEQNGKLIPFNYKKHNFNIGFVESFIVGVNSEKREGFIKKEYIGNDIESDYFFHFDSCSFVPSIGDRVRFIPSINPSKKYKNEPIALLISRVELPRCIIKKILTIYNSKEKRKQYFSAVAKDVNSDLELYINVSNKALKFVSGLKESTIKRGQIFEYVLLEGLENESTRKVKLVRLV